MRRSILGLPYIAHKLPVFTNALCAVEPLESIKAESSKLLLVIDYSAGGDDEVQLLICK